MRKIHRKTPVSETLFAKDSNLTQICKTQICKPKAVKKEALAQVFSCEFSEISKNIFFTEHLRTTASAFSFSEAATRSALWKRCSEKSRKIYRKHLWFAKFSRTLSLHNTSATATLLKWGTAKSVRKTLDEYSLSRNTNLKSTFQVYHFFLGRINFQCLFSLVYTVYSQKQPPE